MVSSAPPSYAPEARTPLPKQKSTFVYSRQRSAQCFPSPIPAKKSQKEPFESNPRASDLMPRFVRCAGPVVERGPGRGEVEKFSRVGDIERGDRSNESKDTGYRTDVTRTLEAPAVLCEQRTNAVGIFRPRQARNIKRQEYKEAVKSLSEGDGVFVSICVV